MANSDFTGKEFIEYWDKVIDFWMDKEVKGSKGERRDVKRPLEKQKESYYKDDNINVQIEEDQLCWFMEDKKNPLNKLLCPIHMPEPYWGDPGSCSIVVVDYNPAGGKDMNPHTYRGNGKYPENTIIDYVNKESYSKLAKDFPILKAKEDLEKDCRWWLRSYGGRQWWREKIEWMLHLIQPDSKPAEEWPENICYPFAIELCGWHSPNWPDNTKAIDGNKDLKEPIRKWFVKPLLHAIENSTCKMAVCIGAQFKPSILEKYFDKGNINITKDIADSLPEKISTENYVYTKMDDDDIVSILNKDSIGQTDYCLGVAIRKNETDKKETKRFYRIYNVVNNNVGHIILNTFAPGSNHHPAKEFWEFEKRLQEAIEEYRKNSALKF